jgi:hypothetical protein
VTYPASRAINLDGTGNLPQAVTAGLGTVRLPGEMIYRLNSDLAGSNVNTVQKIFGVGVTLTSSIVYQFEGWYSLYKLVGTTSHTIAIGFGGTATLNNLTWQIYENWASGVSADPTGLTLNADSSYYNTTGLIASTSAITGANSYFYGLIKGTVSINSGGTFIPQYQLSAAPGGAYSTLAGSYFKISPISASGANTSIGNWS